MIKYLQKIPHIKIYGEKYLEYLIYFSLNLPNTSLHTYFILLFKL